ncbi:hypothetical protein QA646_24740 (plasmid) [Rhizobium sp. CB3090]|uniref:hypothetical protein n=1 Tax=Rhizobium sp. CB3090 TaxID=3039156 RepID=UPI0024B1BC50|nr:hypothetical protein [Rhizobium sp. CB3090]WFU11600.1 hypothetical protein QA646_24740 [Rhizobium sp. CB3090]
MRKANDTNTVSQQATAAISAGHLLHPAMHFGHPREVLTDENISKDEKQAILASWASDISAIESIPALRRYPGMSQIVSYDEVLAALKALDDDDQCRVTQNSSPSIDTKKTNRRRPQAHRSVGFGLCSYWKGGRAKQPFGI